MQWGPARGVAIGGIALGAVLLVVGTLLFLVNQRIIAITFDFWTVCALGLIVLGIVVLGGTVWAHRMMRGGWRKWMLEEDRPGP